MHLYKVLINGVEKYYPECYYNECLAQGIFPTQDGFLSYIEDLRVKKGYNSPIIRHENLF